MKKIIYLTPDETKELFTVIDRDSTKHRYRNRAIFYLAKYCALRVSELSKIELCDYNEEEDAVFCKRVNRSNSNVIYIYEDVTKQALSEYCKLRLSMNINSNYLFVSQKQYPISRQMLDCLMKEYCKETSIPEEKWHFHVLRHTRAIELLKMGLDIQEVQWWLGHKDIRNTMEYLKEIKVSEQDIFKKIKEGV